MQRQVRLNRICGRLIDGNSEVFPALGFCENKTLRLLGKPTTFFSFPSLGGLLANPQKGFDR